MEPDLGELLAALVRGEVDFVLVGGFAAVAHGCTLVTHDVDVAIALDPDNLVQLWQVLQAVNPQWKGVKPRRAFTEEDARNSRLKNLYLETDLGRLDCLGEVKAVGDYAQCVARSVEWDFGGSSVRILDRQALIESKLAIGRERDRQAVTQLEMIGKLEGAE